jgi:hypothetical protein
MAQYLTNRIWRQYLLEGSRFPVCANALRSIRLPPHPNFLAAMVAVKLE